MPVPDRRFPVRELVRQPMAAVASVTEDLKTADNGRPGGAPQRQARRAGDRRRPARSPPAVCRRRAQKR